MMYVVIENGENLITLSQFLEEVREIISQNLNCKVYALTETAETMEINNLFEKNKFNKKCQYNNKDCYNYEKGYCLLEEGEKCED